MKKIKLGIYRHYKGRKCEVISLGRHSETLESFVIYRHGKKKELWVRPAKMFSEKVIVDGKKIYRFTFLKPSKVSE